ncbi:MAG: hypothetical protein M1155_01395 [Patescibacteria group bacterium]|nr:hypothetical protein [Patescibacteria group bacterium]
MSNFIDLPPNADPLIAEKWKKLLSRAWLFKLVPFVDMVLVAGSMAIGNFKEESDFDVIVGAKKGRIFTARFFCYSFFGIFGWRRKKDADHRSSKDKYCFNHFVTPERYCLSEPYNEYWKKLYASLVPIYGEKEKIQSFYDANAGWMTDRKIYSKDARHRYPKPGYIKLFLEKALDDKFGDFFEDRLKIAQISKIEKSLIRQLADEKQYKPRIVFNDNELEFHPDTKRIEEMLNKKDI